MSNNEIVSKLLQGTDEFHQITVKNGDEDLTIELRPLTSGELTKLKSIEKAPYSMKIGVNNQGKRKSVKKENVDESAVMDVGMGEFTEAQADAIYTAVAWSMSTDSIITVEDVRRFPKGIPEEIFSHVIDISNLTEEDLTTIKQFR